MIFISSYFKSRLGATDLPETPDIACHIPWNLPVYLPSVKVLCKVKWHTPECGGGFQMRLLKKHQDCKESIDGSNKPISKDPEFRL